MTILDQLAWTGWGQHNWIGECGCAKLIVAGSIELSYVLELNAYIMNLFCLK